MTSDVAQARPARPILCAREDLPDAWDRAEPVKGIAIVALGVADDREFEVSHERIVLVDQHHIDFHALADARIGEVFDDAVAIAGVRQTPPKRRCSRASGGWIRLLRITATACRG